MEEKGDSFLEKQIEFLENENRQLRAKLNSKRYHMIDKVVDTSYRFVPQALREKKKNDRRKEIEKKRNFIKGRVDIVNHNFYDWDGEVVYRGGAERYVYDLAILLKKMGYSPRILQGAKNGFEKKYRGIPVIGVKATRGDCRELSKLYNKFCRDSEFVIASPTELACELVNVPCIAINHGVNFDGPWTSMYTYPINQYAIYTDALKNVTSCVCVDTNFINWVRTKDYELSSKLTYIPNYYDKNSFKPSERKHTHDKTVFVYPRRIYEPRGYDITIRAFRSILKTDKSIELRFVGQIDNDKAKNDIEGILRDYPENVFHCEYAMEEAYKAYDGADIVLVPTRYSEGTSLSCIEAQALGIPVIATNIGGLPNIIIDHFNGLLISPTADSLEVAVRELLSNPKMREDMSRRSAEIARSSFEKTMWDKRWVIAIDDFLKSVNSENGEEQK